jgi:hypothetical protein
MNAKELIRTSAGEIMTTVTMASSVMGFCLSQLWSVGILSQIYMPCAVDWSVGSVINTVLTS